jgi:hypothetical protein
MTNFVANASYSRTRTNDTSLTDLTSYNGNFGVALNTQFGPKTSGSAGVTYSVFNYSGSSNTQDSDTATVYVTVNHTF